MKTKFISAFVFASLLTAPVAFAQEEAVQAVPEVTPLDARIEKLEKLTAKLPKISGFINARYQYNESSAIDKNNTFDVRRLRFSFAGDLGTMVDYRFQFDFGAGATNPLLDAYTRFKIHSAFNVTVGQTKIPFAIENPLNSMVLEEIDNSLVINYLSGFNDSKWGGVNAGGRDVGVIAYGSFLKQDGYNLVDYSVGLFNGNGKNLADAKIDNNRSKDFSGRVYVNPFKELSVAISHYNGNLGSEKLALPRVRTGAGIKFDDKKLMVRSEYIFGTTKVKTGETIETDGAYAVVAYRVTDKIQPLLKYDYALLNRAAGETTQAYYTVGVNYFFTPKVKLQLNYSYRTGFLDVLDIDGKSAAFTNAVELVKKDYNYVALQLVTQF